MYASEKQVVVFAFVIVIFMFCLLRLIDVGTTLTEGTLLYIDRGPLKDCMKLSLTTQGESVTKTFCEYADFKTEAKIGDRVRVVYRFSPIPFANKIELFEKVAK